MSKYLAESYDKALRENYALRQENERLVAANKARDEFLRGHRYKRSEMDGYIGLCESQMDALKARLAEAERQRDLLLDFAESVRDGQRGDCDCWVCELARQAKAAIAECEIQPASTVTVSVTEGER